MINILFKISYWILGSIYLIGGVYAQKYGKSIFSSKYDWLIIDFICIGIVALWFFIVHIYDEMRLEIELNPGLTLMVPVLTFLGLIEFFILPNSELLTDYWRHTISWPTLNFFTGLFTLLYSLSHSLGNEI